MDLKNIIKGCKRNDRASREALYRATADDMMNICLRYTTDISKAQDIFQESYLRVFQKIDQFDESRGSIKAWMSRIAVNNALMDYRKNRKVDLFESFTSVLEPVTNDDIIADLSADEIFKKINDLPEGYKLVFNLFVVEGYNHNEIGEMLEISASTSRSQLARAKSLLRKRIKKNENRIAYEQAK